MWNKVNLVTQQDRNGMYDEYRCDQCGFKKRYYTLRIDRHCPKCEANKKNVPIYGGWTAKGILKKVGRKCNWCGEGMVIVPKKGHPNSRYWSYQRLRNEVLICCPNGCLEDGSNVKKKPRKLKRRRKKK